MRDNIYIYIVTPLGKIFKKVPIYAYTLSREKSREISC